MKQDASYFDGHEPVLIYIAKKLRDALRLETVLPITLRSLCSARRSDLRF